MNIDCGKEKDRQARGEWMKGRREEEQWREVQEEKEEKGTRRTITIGMGGKETQRRIKIGREAREKGERGEWVYKGNERRGREGNQEG